MSLLPGGKPNHFVIVLDDMTWGEFGPETFPATHARLAALSSGYLQFPNLVASTPRCGPVRGTLLTGMRSDHTGIFDNNDASAQTRDFGWTRLFQNALKVVGYRTMLVGKYMNAWGSGTTGGLISLAGWDHAWVPFRANTIGNPNYVSYEAQVKGLVGSVDGGRIVYGNQNGPLLDSAGNDYSTDVTTLVAEELIDLHATSAQPFFLYWSPEAPHEPYIVATRHADAGGNPAQVGTLPAKPSDTHTDLSDKPLWIQNNAPWSDAQKATWTGYHTQARRCCRSVDEGIIRILDAIEAKGVTANTIVWFVADQGNLWKRYNWMVRSGGTRKSVNYPEVARMSAWAIWPGQTSRTIPQVCSSLDLPATWYDLAGAKPVAGVTLDGRSMFPLVNGVGPAWREVVETSFQGTDDAPKWWGLHMRREGGPVEERQAVYTEWNAGNGRVWFGTTLPTPGDVEVYPSLVTSGAAVDGEVPDCTVNVAADATFASTKTKFTAELAALKVQSEGQRINAARPRNKDGSRVALKVLHGISSGGFPSFGNAFAGTPANALIETPLR